MASSQLIDSGDLIGRRWRQDPKKAVLGVLILVLVAVWLKIAAMGGRTRRNLPAAMTIPTPATGAGDRCQ